jgi:Flp pilus assembly protein TadD
MSEQPAILPTARPGKTLGRLVLGALVIIALVCVIYRPILPGSFLMDDRRLIESDNPLVNGESGPGSIWFRTDFALSTFGFWAQWLAWGSHPGCYHAVNMALQAVSAILLWRVLAGLKVPGAWLAGALFAAHPVCVNSVARIAEFKNTLSLPFFLAGIQLYLPNIVPNGRNDGGDMPAWRYGLSLLAFVLALLSKTSTVMLPLVLLGCVAWQRGRITRRDLWPASPFFVLALGFGLMSAWFQKHQALTGSILQPETIWERLAMAGRIFWFYLGKALLPSNLNLVYPQWKADVTGMTDYVPDLLICAMFGVCWKFRHGWGRHVLAGLGIFALTLFPALGFFDSQFLTKWRVSDHLQYLPLMAPIALVAAALAVALPKLTFRGVAAALIVFWSILTFQRAQVFASEESLFRDTLAKNPEAWGIQGDLGVILAARHDFAGAEERFKTSLRLRPGNPDAESNLGQVMAMEGKPREAEEHFQAALRVKPDDIPTQQRYAGLLMRESRFREAVVRLRVVLTLSAKPGIRPRLDYANVLHITGDLRESAVQLRRVIDEQPDSVEALNNLAWLLATAPDPALRDGSRAVEYAERASRLPAPGGICMPGTLAAAYAEAGRFEEAIATAEKAIKTETAAGESRLASINGQLLRYYRAGKPFREPPSAGGGAP